MAGQRRAVAYLRKSKVRAGSNDVSWETQEVDVRAMAARYGHEDVEILSDWNRSGGSKKTHLRPDYKKLLDLIEADEVDALYSYSLSRLGRSVGELSRLAGLCAEHGVPIRLGKEGELNFTSPYGRFQLHLLGALAEMELDVARERANDTIATRRARGEHVGPVPYGYHVVNGEIHRNPDEDVVLVLSAYRETRSYQAAARLLTMAHVPTRKGGKWGATAVRSIITREAPGMVVAGVSRGRSGAAKFRLGGLIRCGGCDATLTGGTSTRVRNGHEYTYVTYGCRRAPTDPDHGRPSSISEGKLLPEIERAVRRVRSSPQGLSQVRERKVRLEARRSRIVEAFLDGTLTTAERDEALAGVSKRLEKAARDLTLHEDLEPVPLIGEPREVNSFLRRLIEYVQLAPDFTVAEVVYAIPESERGLFELDALLLEDAKRIFT